MTDRAAGRRAASPAAARQRRYRARTRQGHAMLRVKVQYHEVVAALLESTRLTEAEALDRKRVESAVSDVLRDWADKWREINRYT